MHDEDLHDRLAGLAAGADLALPDSHEVRARGDRRRARASIVAAGLSILAVMAGVAGAWSAETPAASLSVKVGKPSPSLTSPPVPQASSAVPRPSGSSSPSENPASSYPQSPTPTAGSAAVTKIPAGLLMFDEGEAGWTTDNSPNVPSAFNPCGGSDVTAVGRTDARTLRGPGPDGNQSHSPSKVTNQLFVFATEHAATTALLGLSAGGCGWTRMVFEIGPYSAPEHRGDVDSTHFARLYNNDAYTPEPGVYWVHDAVLIRTRNVLLVAYSETGGAGMSANLADYYVDDIVGPLCEAGLVCR